MDTTQTPIANPAAVLREEFDDWAVLFNPDTADVVGVSPVGVAVWKLLDGKRTIADIVAEVRSQFSAVSDTVEGEVSAFLADLAEEGFVGYEVQGAQA